MPSRMYAPISVNPKGGFGHLGDATTGSPAK